MPQIIKKLILIDANALMHRAYHALPPLATKKGELTNAVYGFTSVLLKVIKELKPDYMICAFDVAGPTFRDKEYKEYKAGRVKPGQEFYDQIPRIKEIVKAFNIPIYEKRGFEADDVIGTLAKKLEIRNWELEIIIVTGDLDALQLVSDKTKVYTLRKGIKDTVIYDKEAVKKRYGLEPKQIVDFKGLRGDPSDNIPGVNGIGEKGAIDLLKNFHSVEELYQAIEENKTGDLIKPKIKEKLIAQKEQALMSKKLATIKRDMDIEADLKKCVWGDYDKSKLIKLFRELNFYSLIKRVEENEKKLEIGNWKHSSSSLLMKEEAEREFKRETENETQDIKHRTIILKVLDTEKKINEFLEEIKKQKKFIFKTVSNGDGIMEKKMKGMVFSWEKGKVYYLPMELETEKNIDPYQLFPPQEEVGVGYSVDSTYPQPFPKRGIMNNILEKIKPILENENHQKIGFNFKEDFEVLINYQINPQGLKFDCRLAAYLLDPGKKNYSLDKIIFDYLGRHDSEEKIIYEQEEKEKLKSASKFAKLSHLLELSEKLEKELEKTGMNYLFYNIEMPLIKILVKMEEKGIKLDATILKKISAETAVKIKQLEEEIYRMSGEVFNIKSSQQLAKTLFEKMRIPTEDIKKTKTGYSTAASELEKLAGKHSIINLISEYRELVKLKSTYLDTLPKLASQKTQRLRTTFHQTATATGRLSSSDPNLQNIPVRTEAGRKIRRAFVAEEKCRLLSADYSQLELRIVASIADDKKMKEIFREGGDIHQATAAEINQTPVEKVTPEMRRAAKALNFGVIYGMSVFGFARSAGISRDRAKEFIKNYMEKFKGVARYIEQSKIDAKKKGYAETLWGRRRYLPELNSPNFAVKNAAERMAINMPIQGTAADIIKIAMIKIDKFIAEKNRDGTDHGLFPLLQVHDELIFSVQNDGIKEIAREIKKIMEDVRKINVPIVVDIKAGKNWDEMEVIQYV